MSSLTRRKPVLWILVDLVGTACLLFAGFKFFEVDVPYVSDFIEPIPVTLLASAGIILTVASMVLFLVPVIKASNKTNENNKPSKAVERSKR